MNEAARGGVVNEVRADIAALSALEEGLVGVLDLSGSNFF
jgi:hypothetical protein